MAGDGWGGADFSVPESGVWPPELLERLALSEKPIDVGAWSEEEADRAREAVTRSRESFER